MVHIPGVGHVPATFEIIVSNGSPRVPQQDAISWKTGKTLLLVL